MYSVCLSVCCLQESCFSSTFPLSLWRSLLSLFSSAGFSRTLRCGVVCAPSFSLPTELKELMMWKTLYFCISGDGGQGFRPARNCENGRHCMSLPVWPRVSVSDVFHSRPPQRLEGSVQVWTGGCVSPLHVLHLCTGVLETLQRLNSGGLHRRAAAHVQRTQRMWWRVQNPALFTCLSTSLSLPPLLPSSFLPSCRLPPRASSIYQPH